MFDSLADRIRRDERERLSTRERLVLWIVLGIVSVLSFGGLYWAVQMLE
jgi:hypothetical protein